MNKTKDPDEHLKTLAGIKSKLYESILIMEDKVLKADPPAGHQDLISLYVSLIADCTALIQWHARQAAGFGAALKEMRQAADIGAAISGNSPVASASVAFTMENIGHLFAAESQNPL